MKDYDVKEQVQRVETAIERVEALPKAAREAALDAMAELLALYGEAWTRVLEAVGKRIGPNTVDRIIEDDLVGHLLMVHGLHPEQQAMRHAVPETSTPQLVQIEGPRARAAP